MADHASLECTGCHLDFPAALPLSRAALARSRIVFLVEQCPACGQAFAYQRGDYHFAPQRQLISA